MPDKPNINLITLGCAKNLVDSEYLAKQLNVNGFSIAHESAGFSDIVIINTCGFINDAKQESIETIMHYVEAKKRGAIKQLIVMGCLSQRYKKELKKEIPEVDGYFGVEEQRNIVEFLNAKYNDIYASSRMLGTPNHFAYLKIAEGCNRKCAFCSIPLIRGNYKSKPIKLLQTEASILARNGVKEINLIAQDLSSYGFDIYKKYALGDLLKELARTDIFQWIRLLYFYPSNFPVDILDIMRDNPSICNYLDIPFQHASDKVLKYMKRGIDKKNTYKLIELIKNKIPDVSLRTTLMVGHPGETEKDFYELMNFVQDIEFDRLGVFAYSEEEDTFSANNYFDAIPQSVKEDRVNEVMEIQQDISYKKNQSKIGNNIEVLVDREDGENYYARSESDAPEVDNEIILPKKYGELELGSFYHSRIEEAWEYDLIARIVNKKASE